LVYQIGVGVSERQLADRAGAISIGVVEGEPAPPGA
jgi:hypothetical protein